MTPTLPMSTLGIAMSRSEQGVPAEPLPDDEVVNAPRDLRSVVTPGRIPARFAVGLVVFPVYSMRVPSRVRHESMLAPPRTSRRAEVFDNPLIWGSPDLADPEVRAAGGMGSSMFNERYGEDSN